MFLGHFVVTKEHRGTIRSIFGGNKMSVCLGTVGPSPSAIVGTKTAIFRSNRDLILTLTECLFSKKTKKTKTHNLNQFKVAK